MTKHLTLISQYALYPMHWEAFRIICREYDVRASVLACVPPEMGPVHRQLDYISADDARHEPFRPDVREMPGVSHREQMSWVRDQLRELRPDVVWAQEEPVSKTLLEVLRHYRGDAHPHIVCAIAENLFRIKWRHRWKMGLAWKRLNGMIAVATPSIESIRGVGMPCSVPAETLVAGAQPPPVDLEPRLLSLARSTDDFIVGFAGRICVEKGWHVLLDAIETLPPQFKVALAGGGPQVELLEQRLKSARLTGRATYEGLLPKADLWKFYKALDCLVTPHLTFPHWKEQFGGVLVDGMAVGLPVIGSDSGSIPEVLGPAGLIVPEDDSAALAKAIVQLKNDAALYRRLSDAGPHRFATEFDIPVYARKIARSLKLTARNMNHVDAA